MDIYTNEIWKDIPGYEGLYQASTEGRVRSVSRFVRCGSEGKGQRFVEGRVLRPGRYCKSGHVSVVLKKGCPGVPVHQIIACTFLGPRPDGLDVCHNDGDPTNNRPSNLRYDTRTNNILDTYKNGGAWRKLTVAQVIEIRKGLAAGESGASLARRIGVSEQTVSKIKTGRSYYWLK